MTKRNIPILKILFNEEDHKFLQEGWKEILTSGHLTMGKHTKDFEERFASFTGARYAIACNSGTSALELILRGLGIENKSVIVPTNTFLATALAAMHAGNQVIFADADPETLCLDVKDVEKKITPDTAAVILVHIGGVITPAISDLQKLCHARGLALMEDCAHAHGSKVGDRSAGTLGVAGGFSFFPTKVMVSGEGGMVTTNDENLAQQIRMIRNHGKNPDQKNRMTEFGNNLRMSEITALLGVQQMKRADWIVEERQKVARFYDNALASIEGIHALQLPSNVSSTYYKYIVFLDSPVERAALKNVMKEEYGVALTGEVYADLCHTEPLWNNFTYCGKQRTASNATCHVSCNQKQEGFPGAESVCSRHFCLPLYPGMAEADLEYIVDSLKKALATLAKGSSCVS